MRRTFLLLLTVVGTPLTAVASNAHLSPLQRTILNSESRPPTDTKFSFDALEGPQFTDAEKEAQRELGKGVMPMVKKAFDSGASEVRIPPGDYRFGQERKEGAKTFYPLHFEGMQRDPENPFVIDATGATFWFDLDDEQMPPGHRCVGFLQCRNLVLRVSSSIGDREVVSKAESQGLIVRAIVLKFSLRQESSSRRLTREARNSDFSHSKVMVDFVHRSTICNRAYESCDTRTSRPLQWVVIGSTCRIPT